jgi:hypothetical protein
MPILTPTEPKPRHPWKPKFIQLISFRVKIFSNQSSASRLQRGLVYDFCSFFKISSVLFVSWNRAPCSADFDDLCIIWNKKVHSRRYILRVATLPAFHCFFIRGLFPTPLFWVGNEDFQLTWRGDWLQNGTAGLGYMQLIQCSSAFESWCLLKIYLLADYYPIHLSWGKLPAQLFNDTAHSIGAALSAGRIYENFKNVKIQI